MLGILRIGIVPAYCGPPLTMVMKKLLAERSVQDEPAAV